MLWLSFFGKVINFLGNNVLEAYEGVRHQWSHQKHKFIFIKSIKAAVNIHSKIIFLAVP